MLTSRRLAPPSTCSRAILIAASKLPSLMRRLHLSEPVMLQRSPIMTKLVSGRIVRTSVPLKYDQPLVADSLRESDDARGASVPHSRGLTPWISRAIAAVHSGVVPQQPPTR